MSQTGLADQIGLTFQQIQKYEKGINRIGSSRMVQIASALKVDPGYFIRSESKGDAAPENEMTLLAFAASRDGQAIIDAWPSIPPKMQDALVALVRTAAA